MDDNQPQTRSELEARAQSYEWSADSRSSASAKLKATLASVDLYMRALRIAETSPDRQRLNLKCKNLITQAEDLKIQKDAAKKRALSDPPVSKRKLTTRENIILLEGSKLNGHLFRQWEKPPVDDEFALKGSHSLHTDLPYLQLSDTQRKSFGGWRRPTEALGLITITSACHNSAKKPTMAPLEKVDLVQDLTSDCSVVASLCAGTSRLERGHPDVSLPG
jgi:calpain-7